MNSPCAQQLASRVSSRPAFSARSCQARSGSELTVVAGRYVADALANVASRDAQLSNGVSDSAALLHHPHPLHPVPLPHPPPRPVRHPTRPPLPLLLLHDRIPKLGPRFPPAIPALLVPVPVPVPVLVSITAVPVPVVFCRIRVTRGVEDDPERAAGGGRELAAVFEREGGREGDGVELEELQCGQRVELALGLEALW